MQWLCPWKANPRGTGSSGETEPGGRSSLCRACVALAALPAWDASPWQSRVFLILPGLRSMASPPGDPLPTSLHLSLFIDSFTLSQADMIWVAYALVDTGPASAPLTASAGPCVGSHSPQCPPGALPLDPPVCPAWPGSSR